jgi:hypothetical protein
MDVIIVQISIAKYLRELIYAYKYHEGEEIEAVTLDALSRRHLSTRVHDGLAI